MEAGLLQRTAPPGHVVHRVGAACFGSADDIAQGVVLHLQQPVEMVRHHYPGERIDMSHFVGSSQLCDKEAPYTPI